MVVRFRPQNMEGNIFHRSQYNFFFCLENTVSHSHHVLAVVDKDKLLLCAQSWSIANIRSQNQILWICIRIWLSYYCTPSLLFPEFDLYFFKAYYFPNIVISKFNKNFLNWFYTVVLILHARDVLLFTLRFTLYGVVSPWSSSLLGRGGSYYRIDPF